MNKSDVDETDNDSVPTEQELIRALIRVGRYAA